jgi:protein-tyrosine phosphatase
VLRHLAEKEGIELRIASAGTGDWHVGNPPDERAQRHAKGRGYDLSAQRARQVRQSDFEEFDLILAMDRGHLRALERMAPPEARHKVRLFIQIAMCPIRITAGLTASSTCWTWWRLHAATSSRN